MMGQVIHDIRKRNTEHTRGLRQAAGRKKWLFVLLISLLCSFVAPIAVTAQENKANENNALEEAQRAYNSGMELYHTGNFYTAQEALESAYQKAPENSRLKAAATFDLSGVLWEQGDYVKAYLKVIEAMNRAEKAGVTEARGQLAMRKGLIESARGEFSKANATLTKCVEVADSVSDYEASALCRVSRRYVRKAMGKSPGSESKYKADLNLLKASKKPLLTGIALAKIAETQANSGDYGSALALYQQAQAQFDKSGMVPAINGNKLKIAQIFQDIGRWNDAANLLKELEITFRNMNSRPLLVTTYNLLARQAEHDGNGEEAHNNYKKALRYAVAIASPHLQAQTRLAMCEFFARTTNPSNGITDCQVARGVFKRQGMRSLAARALVSESRLQHMAEHYQEAAKTYRQSLKELAALPASQEVTEQMAIQAANLCQVATALQNDSTLNDCANALKIFDSAASKNAIQTQLLVQTLVRLGLAEQDAKQNDRAVAHLERAVSVADPKVSGIDVANALMTLSHLMEKSDPAKALSYAEKSVATSAALEKAAITGSIDNELRVATLTSLAQLQVAQKQPEKALKTLRTLADVAKGSEKWDRAAWACIGMAKVYQEGGKAELSQKALKEGLVYAERGTDKEQVREIKRFLKE